MIAVISTASAMPAENPIITLIQLKNGWFQMYATSKINPDSHGLTNTVTSYTAVDPSESIDKAFQRLKGMHEYHLSQPNNEDHAY